MSENFFYNSRVRNSVRGDFREKIPVKSFVSCPGSYAKKGRTYTPDVRHSHTLNVPRVTPLF